MGSLSDTLERLKRGPTDVVGIDLRATETVAVRLAKTKDAFSLVAADSLPAVVFPDDESESPVAPAPLKLPAKLRAPYASLAVSCDGSAAKLMSFPGGAASMDEEKLTSSLGIAEPEDSRISYRLLSEGHRKAESTALCVAIPDVVARDAVALLPSGRPAPFSLELSGLAAMTAFVHTPATAEKGACVGAIDFGPYATILAFFYRRNPVLLRMFEFGTGAILARVQESLGVDADTARGIVTDGAFDVSHLATETVGNLIDRIAVSRDFVERRENCPMGKMYVSGNMTLAQDLISQMKTSMDVDTWDPLAAVTVEDGAIPEHLAEDPAQLAGAIGACLGTLEGS